MVELTVACLISPVAVWPARKTSPGTLTAGPMESCQPPVSKAHDRCALRNYSQLCGLGGNFSLEISWRDILALTRKSTRKRMWMWNTCLCGVVETGAKSEQCTVSNLVCLSKIHWSCSRLFVLSIEAETVAIVIIGKAEELCLQCDSRRPTCSAKSNLLRPVGRSSSHPSLMRNLAI